MAMQLAKAVTGAKIIAMDLEDEKLKVARKDGHADNIVNSKEEDPVKTVMELTDKMGADAVIDFVNASKTVETDMQFLRRRAKVVLVGLYGLPRPHLLEEQVLVVLSMFQTHLLSSSNKTPPAFIYLLL